MELLVNQVVDKLKNDPEFMASVKGEPGAPGQDGLPGAPGAAGSAGPAGKDGRDGVVDLTKLPPLRLQTLKPDGTVHQDVTARLGDLVRLKAVVVGR